LFDFTEQKEKLFCFLCKSEQLVKDIDGNRALLECGHVELRESNGRMLWWHKWHQRHGFPSLRGGWYEPPNKDVYPMVSEMKQRAKMSPEIVGEIRKVMGKKWEPGV
jgi:hypothetical protein